MTGPGVGPKVAGGLMGRVASGSRSSRVRGAVVLIGAGCAALAAVLPPGHGAAGESGTAKRTANAEVMVITRGALEGGLSPSG